jgi:Raf kinase inhibitor-like YbhB/YbcL family protein
MGDTLEVTSSAVVGGKIPAEFTCDGSGRVLPLTWSEPPPGTQTFAIVVHDPDAPKGDFVHWLAWNLPADVRTAGEETAVRATEGKNDFGKIGWGGPCPPRGHGPHRYVFEVVAVDRTLSLKKGSSREALEEALRGHVLARGRIVAHYERSSMG